MQHGVNHKSTFYKATLVHYQLNGVLETDSVQKQEGQSSILESIKSIVEFLRPAIVTTILFKNHCIVMQDAMQLGDQLTVYSLHVCVPAMS